METLISRRYATALFEAVQESETSDAAAVLQELQSIHTALNEIPDFQQFFTSPVIGDREKKEFISRTVEGKISPEVYHFMLILIDKSREIHFGDIVQTFQKLTEAAQNKVKAVVVTAVPMNEAMQEQMSESLGAMTGKKVSVVNVVDESVLGGVKIRIEDRVIDNTISNRLNQLKEELTQLTV
jgi:F-type H+-transporting ATPase subunit delta